MPDFILSLLPGLTWPQAALLAVTVFLAGLLRGFTGFGFALAAIPILTLFLPPGAIVPAVSVVALLAGVELLPKAWPAANFRAIRRLLLGALAGTPFARCPGRRSNSGDSLRRIPSPSAPWPSMIAAKAHRGYSSRSASSVASGCRRGRCPSSLRRSRGRDGPGRGRARPDR